MSRTPMSSTDWRERLAEGLWCLARWLEVGGHWLDGAGRRVLGMKL